MHRRPGSVALTDDAVLAAVIALAARYHAPSTSRIVWHLAEGASVTAAMQTHVRDALARLHAAGRLACVTHRGTRRWSAPAPDTTRPT